MQTRPVAASPSWNALAARSSARSAKARETRVAFEEIAEVVDPLFDRSENRVERSRRTFRAGTSALRRSGDRRRVVVAALGVAGIWLVRRASRRVHPRLGQGRQERRGLRAAEAGRRSLPRAAHRRSAPRRGGRWAPRRLPVRWRRISILPTTTSTTHSGSPARPNGVTKRMSPAMFRTALYGLAAAVRVPAFAAVNSAVNAVRVSFSSRRSEMRRLSN